MESITKSLIKELEACAEKILLESEINRKMFFLDMASDLIGAYLFFEQDDDLIFAEFVLEVCQGTVESALEEESYKRSLLSNASGLIDEIAKNLLDMTTSIEKDQPYYKILQKIVKATYSFTKPGIYATMKK